MAMNRIPTPCTAYGEVLHPFEQESPRIGDDQGVRCDACSQHHGRLSALSAVRRRVRAMQAVILLCLPLLLSCARITTQRLPSEQLLATDTFAVFFEFDRANLAQVFASALTEAGFSMAKAPASADILLTGTYSATRDLVHDRFDFSQFKLVRQQTGRTIVTLQTGQGGLQSAPAVVRRMVEELARLRDQP